jgi:hypothetical protein
MLYLCTDETTKFIFQNGYPQEGIFPSVATIVFTQEGIEKWNNSYSQLKKGKNLNSKEAQGALTKFF